MKEALQKQTKKRNFAALGIIFAILGLLLFAYSVRVAGVAEIISGMRRLGAGFVLILGLSAIRQTVRSLAWMGCFELPYRLRFSDAFLARVMGDALGNIIPLGALAVSEPAKVGFVRDRVPLLAGASALAIENIFYGLSVVLFVSSGAVVLLLSFPLPRALRYVSIGALVTTFVIAALGYLIIRKQWKFISGALAFLTQRKIGRKWIVGALPRVRTLEDRIYGFYQRNRARFLVILFLEACFHLAGVAEAYAALFFISAVAPNLLTAFILESVNRVITMGFKFVPFRAGFDEAGTGMLSKVLGFTTATGVTLAITRKARDICWTAVGVGLMVRRGLKPSEVAKDVAKEPEEMIIHKQGHSRDRDSKRGWPGRVRRPRRQRPL